MSSGSQRSRAAEVRLPHLRYVRRTDFLGVSFSIRKGYLDQAFHVSPPPHGFSHTSFSSIIVVSRPAADRRAAVNAPAGPPPRTTTRFIASDSGGLLCTCGRRVYRRVSGRKRTRRPGTGRRSIAERPFRL